MRINQGDIHIGDDQNRFVLGNCHANEISIKTLFCIGVNPSIASSSQSDPTWARVKEMALKKGFDNAVMLNLYPKRATHFNDLSRELDTELHLKNIDIIKSLFVFEKPNIWCAWGNLIDGRLYLKDCLRDIYALVEYKKPNWLYLNQLTKAGNPIHPSARGKAGFTYSMNFSPFHLKDYVDGK